MGMSPKMVSALVALADTNTLPEVGAATLARSPSKEVRLAIARSASTTEPIRASLRRDGCSSVRIASIAHSADTSLLEADVMSAPERSMAVAANPLTDPSVMVALSKHAVPAVLRAVLENPLSPWEATCRAAYRKTPDVLFAQGASAFVSAGVGRTVTLHPSVGAVWASSPNTLVARAIARAPGLPLPAVKKLLARHDNGPWRKTLADNPTVPAGLLRLSGARQSRRTQVEFAAENLSAETARECLELGSRTLDAIVAEKLPVSRYAFSLLVRRSPTLVEADTLATFIEAGGMPFARLARESLSITKIAATLSYSPTLQRLHAGVEPDLAFDSPSAIEEFLGLLGESPAAWEALPVLANDWSGSVLDLAETLSRLQ